MKEIILDIIGIVAVLLSLYAYFFMGFDFNECTLIGVAGLSLFILKDSSIRKIVERIIDKFLKK